MWEKARRIFRMCIGLVSRWVGTLGQQKESKHILHPPPIFLTREIRIFARPLRMKIFLFWRNGVCLENKLPFGYMREKLWRKKGKVVCVSVLHSWPEGGESSQQKKTVRRRESWENGIKVWETAVCSAPNIDGWESKKDASAGNRKVCRIHLWEMQELARFLVLCR